MDWSLDAEEHSPRLPRRRVEAWSRLNLLLPYLLLHQPPQPPTPHAQVTAAESPASARRRLQQRLLRAENCDFTSLIEEAIQNERIAAVKASEAPLRQQTALENQATAAEKAEDGCLRTAARLLQGDAVLPSCPATADAVEALYALEPGPDLPERRRGAVHAIAPHRVLQRVRRARGTAHPGPCGERNTHLHALCGSPHASVTLARWVNSWLHTDLSIGFRTPWMTCGLVALDKGQGKPRPIVFQECLLKLATGSIVDTCAPELRAGAGAWQRGVYDPGGTTQMVWDLRAAMVARPFDIVTGIDCRNAFGEAQRAPAARIADKHSPTFARLLHNLWDHTHPEIHVPDGPGCSRTLHVRDGFVQGGCEAGPAFALAFREAVDRFQEEAKRQGLACRLWAYMDDLYFQCSPDHWEGLMTLLTAELARIGLTCRADKCRCHVPAYSDADVLKHAPKFAAFATLQAGGLPILGTVADGQYAVVLGPTDLQQPAAHQRLERAVKMCGHLADLFSAPINGPRRHPAWRILDSVVNHCLAYDVSVSDPGATAPLGRRLDEVVLTTAAKILQADALTERQQKQLRLSKEQGGCGLRAAEDRCSTAFLAALLRLGAGLCVDDSAALAQDGLICQARHALDLLHGMGIILDQHGMPHNIEQPPTNPFDPALHLQQRLPKRQRAWWGRIDQRRAAKLASIDDESSKRLRSCGGAEGGAYLRAVKSEMGASFTDNEFVLATRYRLGMRTMQAGTCRHLSGGGHAAKIKSACNAPADPDGHHAVQCKTGGAPYAAHSQGSNILLAATQQAGYQARREQIVPEFATPACPSPQIDVEGWSTTGLQRLLIDFSIRHPASSHYSVGQIPTEVADREKAGHYVGRQGLKVICAAMETYGRHGAGLTALLEQLADLARERERAFGLPPTRWLRRWRAQLSCTVAKLVGRSIQTACPPGTSCC